MKYKILLAVLICIAFNSVNGQRIYNGLRLLHAKSDKADYSINDEWVRGSWTISPQIAFDTLFVACFDKAEQFGFYTDRDTIQLELSAGVSQQFYVLLDTAYAHTIITGYNPGYKALSFDEQARNGKYKFRYERNKRNDYLDRLKSLYPIDSLVEGAATDMDKTLRILGWVHKQWQHNGNNQPEKGDAISILQEVKEGKNFRCVEYGIVASACLNSVGLKARTLALKTKDVETTEYGAGHVLTEVYLDDIEKWVLIDGQWDAMPVLNGVPLNAVEFQAAIANNYKELEIRSSTNTSKRSYINWVYPYLYYFDVKFDNREEPGLKRKEIDGKRCLMLVPRGAKNPTVFQVNGKIDYCLYTNSIQDFYAPPGR